MREIGLNVQFQESPNINTLYEFSIERGSMSVVVVSDQNREHFKLFSPTIFKSNFCVCC